MFVRFRHKLIGGHVHVGVFVGPDSDHLAKSGELVFRDYEWELFRKGVGPRPGLTIDFMKDEYVSI